MDYSIFDVLLDSVFIINDEKEVIYCNETAATLCDSSVRRMTKGKPIYSFIQFSEKNLMTMPSGTLGKDEVYPLTEVDYMLPNDSKGGKVQLTIQPFAEASNRNYVVLIRDVTVEEVLHSKYKKQLEQLENYSKNLEKMVADRTFELNQANQLLSAIMNSLGQGFLVFDKEGQCKDVYTKACEEVLETIPSGKSIVDVLSLQNSDKEQFEMWMQAVFTNSLPFESLKDLAPKNYSHSKDKKIALDYFSIPDGEEVQNVVLVATDQTAEYLAQKALELEKQNANMILKMVSNPRQFRTFLLSVPKHISEIRSEVKKELPDVNKVFRILHTLEGESGAFSVMALYEQSKLVQDIMSSWRSGEATYSSIQDSFSSSLEVLEKYHFEFVKNNEAVISMITPAKQGRVYEVDEERALELEDLLAQQGLEKSIVSQFFANLSKKSIGQSLNYLNNVVRQVADKQGKEIKSIIFEGLETKVESNYFDEFFASLVHVFRNIVDHGIEMPEERSNLGKPKEGQVKVQISNIRENNAHYLKMVIVDDGKGVDPKAIKGRLVERGLDVSHLNDHEVIQHIFDAGLSSRKVAGEFSGRGVGMDAVKTEVEKLGGRVEVFSEVGKGTRLVVLIPEPDSLSPEMKAA